MIPHGDFNDDEDDDDDDDATLNTMGQTPLAEQQKQKQQAAAVAHRKKVYLGPEALVATMVGAEPTPEPKAGVASKPASTAHGGRHHASSFFGSFRLGRDRSLEKLLDDDSQPARKGGKDLELTAASSAKAKAKAASAADNASDSEDEQVLLDGSMAPRDLFAKTGMFHPEVTKQRAPRNKAPNQPHTRIPACVRDNTTPQRWHCCLVWVRVYSHGWVPPFFLRLASFLCGEHEDGAGQAMCILILPYC
jgi:hypothetical protein